MTVRVDDGVIVLAGPCPVEDAEPLLRALQDGAAAIDLTAATRLHTAIVQLLLAARPSIVAMPAEPFLRDLLLPALIEDGAPQAVSR